MAGECRKSGAEEGDLNGPSLDFDDDKEAVLANCGSFSWPIRL